MVEMHFGWFEDVDVFDPTSGKVMSNDPADSHGYNYFYAGGLPFDNPKVCHVWFTCYCEPPSYGNVPNTQLETVVNNQTTCWFVFLVVDESK